MCNKELCKQFVNAHGGNSGICLFNGPTSNDNEYAVKYEVKGGSYGTRSNYSAQNVHY